MTVNRQHLWPTTIYTFKIEDGIDNGMWRLAAAIGGANFYEVFGDRWDDEAYDWASNTSISENQNGSN